MTALPCSESVRSAFVRRLALLAALGLLALAGLAGCGTSLPAPEAPEADASLDSALDGFSDDGVPADDSRRDDVAGGGGSAEDVLEDAGDGPRSEEPGQGGPPPDGSSAGPSPSGTAPDADSGARPSDGSAGPTGEPASSGAGDGSAAARPCPPGCDEVCGALGHTEVSRRIVGAAPACTVLTGAVCSFPGEDGVEALPCALPGVACVYVVERAEHLCVDNAATCMRAGECAGTSGELAVRTCLDGRVIGLDCGAYAARDATQGARCSLGLCEAPRDGGCTQDGHVQCRLGQLCAGATADAAGTCVDDAGGGDPDCGDVGQPCCEAGRCLEGLACEEGRCAAEAVEVVCAEDPSCFTVAPSQRIAAVERVSGAVPGLAGGALATPSVWELERVDVYADETFVQFVSVELANNGDTRGAVEWRDAEWSLALWLDLLIGVESGFTGPLEQPLTFPLAAGGCYAASGNRLSTDGGANCLEGDPGPVPASFLYEAGEASLTLQVTLTREDLIALLDGLGGGGAFSPGALVAGPLHLHLHLVPRAGGR